MSDVTSLWVGESGVKFTYYVRRSAIQAFPDVVASSSIQKKNEEDLLGPDIHWDMATSRRASKLTALLRRAHRRAEAQHMCICEFNTDEAAPRTGEVGGPP